MIRISLCSFVAFCLRGYLTAEAQRRKKSFITDHTLFQITEHKKSVPNKRNAFQYFMTGNYLPPNPKTRLKRNVFDNGLRLTPDPVGNK